MAQEEAGAGGRLELRGVAQVTVSTTLLIFRPSRTVSVVPAEALTIGVVVFTPSTLTAPSLILRSASLVDAAKAILTRTFARRTPSPSRFATSAKAIDTVSISSGT